MRRGALLVTIALAMVPVSSQSHAGPTVSENDKDRFVFGDWIFEDDYKKLTGPYGKPLEAKIQAVIDNDPAVSAFAASFGAPLLAAKDPAMVASTKFAAKVDERVTAELRTLRTARDAAIAREDYVEVLAAEMALWNAYERAVKELEAQVASHSSRSGPSVCARGRWTPPTPWSGRIA